MTNLIRRNPVKALACTDAEFDGIHQALAKVRSTSATVTINKLALEHLLRDYSALLNIAERPQ